jgi:hypothetical protein
MVKCRFDTQRAYAYLMQKKNKTVPQQNIFCVYTNPKRNHEQGVAVVFDAVCVLYTQMQITIQSNLIQKMIFSSKCMINGPSLQNFFMCNLAKD